MSEQSTQPASAGVFAGLTSKHRAIAALILLFFLVLGVVGYKWFSDHALATLIELSGGPKRDTAASIGKWIEAEVGDDFEHGDGARTHVKETAFFRLGSGARLELKPSSQIRFQGARGPGGAIGLKVEVGEADVRTSEGTLAIDSEFGPIVLERNSAITMRRDGERMAISVELGSIELGDTKQSVAAGQNVELEIGGIVVDEAVKAAPAAAPAAAKEEEPEAEGLVVGDGVSRVDLVVTAGEDFVVHDPSPPSAIGFLIGDACSGPAEMRAGKMRTQANKRLQLAFPAGQHNYEVRCLDNPDKVVKKGTVRVLQDSGTRRLPTFTPQANVAADGRKYTVMYQQKLPQVTITWPNAPDAQSFTLQVGGRTISTKSATHTLPSLGAGTHQVIYSAASDPPRRSRPTTITVAYDSQAPAARVSLPDGGFSEGEQVKVTGQALPGWTVSVDGKEVEVDSQRRFSADSEADGTLPIAFSHPTHGMHYYLRRPKK